MIRSIASIAIFAAVLLLCPPSARAQDIVDIRVDPTNRDFTYGLDAANAIYTSRDLGESWRRLAAQPWEALAEFHVDPLDSQRLFVTSTDGLWQSRNRGETWARADLPTNENARLGFDTRASFIVLAQDQQVYRSPDRGDTWIAVAQLPGPVQEIVISDVVKVHALVEDIIYLSPDQGDRFAPDPAFEGVRALDIVASWCGVHPRTTGGWFDHPATPVAAPRTLNRHDRLAGYECSFLWSDSDGHVLRYKLSRHQQGELSRASAGMPIVALDTAPFPQGPYYAIGLSRDAQLAPLDEIGETPLPCPANRCEFELRADRPGFYLFEFGLDESAQSSFWSFEPKDGSFVNGFVGGGPLGASPGAPGFVAFTNSHGLDGASPISVRVEEYTGSLDRVELKIERIHDNGERTTEVGPLVMTVGERRDFNLGEVLGFYAIEVRSLPGDPAGDLGLELNGQHAALSGYGGRLEPGAGGRGFVGLFGTPFRGVLRYGESLPDLTLAYFHPTDGRIPYYPRPDNPPPLAPGNSAPLPDAAGNAPIHYTPGNRVASDPNGRFIAFDERWIAAHYSQRIRARWIDLATGTQRVFPDVSWADPDGVTPDGRIVMSGLTLHDTRTGEVLKRLDPPPGVHDRFVGIADDGALVIFATIAASDPYATEFKLYWLDFETGSHSFLRSIPPAAPYSFDAMPVSAVGENLAVLESLEGRIAVRERRTGVEEIHLLEDIPRRHGDTATAIEDLALRSDGNALLVQVTERYPNLRGRLLSRIFEYTFEDRIWLEIAPSDDPLEPHRSSPRYSGDGSLIFFDRESLTGVDPELGGLGFTTDGHQLIRATRSGELERIGEETATTLRTLETILVNENGDLALRHGRAGLIGWRADPPSASAVD
ncbi:MAG: hypothetical protein AAGE01_24165 [Pseudomonadota bacterium]